MAVALACVLMRGADATGFLSTSRRRRENRQLEMGYPVLSAMTCCSILQFFILLPGMLQPCCEGMQAWRGTLWRASSPREV